MQRKAGHIRGLLMTATATVLLSLSASAKPVIEVPQKDYDAGEFAQGSRDFITHAFKIKNTGDEPLKIIKVRPG